MMNTNYRELNMEELAMVTGGEEIIVPADVMIDENPMNACMVGIPRGGKLKIRV